jgi:hypothetical protein
VKQLGLDPAKLIFIDETWAKTNMTRLRGRSPRGERLIAKVPHGHWKTSTLIAALDHQAIRCSTTVDGSVNSDVFEAFIGTQAYAGRHGRDGQPLQPQGPTCACDD